MIRVSAAGVYLMYKVHHLLLKYVLFWILMQVFLFVLLCSFAAFPTHSQKMHQIVRHHQDGVEMSAGRDLLTSFWENLTNKC